ncbi:hypothetical protein MTR67_025919 [Solanum verrucosum]|uniref:Uncharacterized protein n=2 Tax=Solanum verrucosum TaxID=315347 RepID=A0AAF0QY01_SOLVR|nr:hypothetical protein MTR67_025919 [Solanum verrucosum]
MSARMRVRLGTNNGL